MIRPIPGLPIEQQPLGVLRRLLVWGEARGEPHAGKLAILWVVENRVKQGKQAKAVILAPKQFSCFNPDDPNRDKMLTAHDREPNTWALIDAIVDLWENGVTIDPTRGATHYYTNAISPKWGRGHPTWEDTIEIGNHIFGKQL